MELDVKMIAELVPETYIYKGKLYRTRDIARAIFADGKFDNADIPIVLMALATAQKVQPTPFVIPGLPIPPSPPPPQPVEPSPVIKPPSSLATGKGLLSWTEEMWNDMFRGTVEPDSDWLPGGTLRFNRIMAGRENAPSGTRVRFMAEEPPAGSHVQGQYVIEHVFNYHGTEFIVRSDSDENDQPADELFHIVRGPRWRSGDGWDVTVQFRGFAGPDPRKIVYFARKADDHTIAGNPEEFTLAHR